MATNDTVTLKFTSNTASLDKGFRDVQAGAARTTESLEETGRAAKGAREIMQGATGAATIFGGELGNTAMNASIAFLSIKDLAKGMAALRVATQGAEGALLLGKLALGGIVAATLTAGVAISAHVDHTSMLNEVNRTAADTSYYLADGLHFVAQGVPVLGGLLGSLKGKTDEWSKSAHGAAQTAEQLAQSIRDVQVASNAATYGQHYDTTDGDFGANSQSITSELLSEGIGLDGKQTAASMRAAGLSTGGGGGGGGGSSAIDAARQAAMDKLSKWQGVIDTARSVSQQVMAALAPKLAAGDKGLLLFPGPTLLDKMKKQLEDTKRLAKDVATLTKEGLNGDLIQQLITGGLDSLPAADELVGGGKGSVATANKLAKGINKSAAGLGGQAGIFAAGKAQTVNVKIDVTGGDKELKALVRKWVRVDGGGNVQLALGK